MLCVLILFAAVNKIRICEFIGNITLLSTSNSRNLSKDSVQQFYLRLEFLFGNQQPTKGLLWPIKKVGIYENTESIKDEV